MSEVTVHREVLSVSLEALRSCYTGNVGLVTARRRVEHAMAMLQAALDGNQGESA